MNVEGLDIKTDSSPLLLGQLPKSSDSACGSQICHKNAHSFDPQLQIYQTLLYTVILLGRILRYLTSVETIKETTKDTFAANNITMIQELKVPFTTSKIWQFSSSFAVVAKEFRANNIGDLVSTAWLPVFAHYLTA